MTTYKIRIDQRQDEDRQYYLDLFKKLSTENVILMAYETPNSKNPHYQGLIKSSEKENTIRKYLNRLGFKGNKCYSMKAALEEYPIEYIAYCMKEDKDYYSEGIPQDILDTCINLHLEFVATTTAKKKAKKTYAQIVDEIEVQVNEHCKDLFTPLLKGGIIMNTNKKEILADTILRYFKDNNMIIRRASLQTIFDTIGVRLGVVSITDLIRY